MFTEDKTMKKSKQKINEIREQLAAYHKGRREEEIEDHAGKPFTSHNTPTPKTKYNRKVQKRSFDREDY